MFCIFGPNFIKRAKKKQEVPKAPLPHMGIAKPRFAFIALHRTDVRDAATLEVLNEWMAKRAEGGADFAEDPNIDWAGLKRGDRVCQRPIELALVWPQIDAVGVA